jgi:hypothetical protein
MTSIIKFAVLTLIYTIILYAASLLKLIYDSDMPTNKMVTNYLATIKHYKLNRLNLCAEWVNYTPVALKDIIKSGVLSNISTIHRDYLDKK